MENNSLNGQLMEYWMIVKSEYTSLCTSNPTLSDIYDAFTLCAKLTEDYDESHNIEHHVNVYKNAIIIYKGIYDCTKEILPLIIYASLLHDTVDSKYPDGLKNKIEKLDNFLKEKLSDKWTNVKWIIDNISYSKEAKFGYPLHTDPIVQLARDIVSDADKLEAIGEIGLLRCKQYSIAKNPTASKEEITKIVVQHCYDKLLKIKDLYIRTSTGKNLAEALHQIIVDYI